MHTTIKFLSKKGVSMADSGAPFVTRNLTGNLAGKPSTWRAPVAAAALALVLGLPALDAHALALGRVTVQSALGEPLRAEIDIPDINADEASSLKTTVANPEAFKAAGLEYNPALGSVQISLQKRSDGRSYLRLTGDRPVNEPFVDLILEANWASGRVVRDYTMLFDPANLRATTAQSSAITSAAVPQVYSAPASRATAPRVAAAPSVSSNASPSAPPVKAARQAPARRPEKPVSSTPNAPKDGNTVTVKPGNTANQIAARNKPTGVSLDQMLVAMLRANPDAFINNNLNRLKSGAVLELPTADQASAVNVGEARQVITAQSKDFNDFRRRLAQGAPTAAAPSASRAASGSVQAKVEERKPAAAAPDKLTLSKGAVAAAGGASAAKGDKEDTIAKDRQAKEAAARAAEINKNIQDLNKLGATTTTATAKADGAGAAASAAKAGAVAGVAIATGAPAAPAVTASAQVVSPSATATVTATASAALPAASAAIQVASMPMAAASMAASAATSAVASTAETTTNVAAPVATASAVKPSPAAVKALPLPEPGLVDDLLDNPVTLPAAGGLLALLAGFGFYRMRQRKKTNQVDSSFLESRLQPDSFFGASGGQRIDTSEASGNATGSSMVYSPSQLDAAGDVDPVAEADVYLAYGRDLQAEEILKEAMRTNPTRVAIHTKLMEIYAKRRDTKAFEIVAHEAYSISKGQGPEWEAASAMGRELDPSNPLYQPGGLPMSAGSVGGGAIAAGLAAAAAFGSSTLPQSVHPEIVGGDNVDFDLDFALDDYSTAAPTPAAQQNYTTTSPIHVEPTVSMQPTPSATSPLVDLNFDIPTGSAAAPAFSPSGVLLSAPDMASFTNGLNFSPAAFTAPGSAVTEPITLGTNVANGMQPMEFDMGSLSLDLPGANKAPAVEFGISGDPMETKLALAEEFREIGDNDGARALAQEVATEATGTLKARAQRMVADLS